MLSAYYHDGADWVLSIEERGSEAPVIVRLLSHSFFTDEPTIVAFDNLRVETVYPPQRQCLEPLIDEFDGALVDERYVRHDSYDWPREYDGALHFIKENGHVGEYGITLDPARHVLCGDFDLQVEYELTEFPVPTTGQHYFALRVRDAASGESVGIIERIAAAKTLAVESTHVHRAGGAGVPTRQLAAEGTSSCLRIRRTGERLELIAMDRGIWHTLEEFEVHADALYYELFHGSTEVEDRSEVRCTRLMVTTASSQDQR